MIVYSQATDIELFEYIQSHDSKGLDELFRRYAPQLHRFAFQIVQNDEDAKELVSDLFLQLWLKGSKIQIRTQVKAYLYTALRNLCLNHLRQNSLPTDDLTEAENDPSLSTGGTDRLLTETDASKLVESILSKLPPQRRIVFQMQRIDGLSYQEIAAILSISEHTVHRHMVAAVKQLAEHYPNWKTDFLLVMVISGMLIYL